MPCVHHALQAAQGVCHPIGHAVDVPKALTPVTTSLQGAQNALQGQAQTTGKLYRIKFHDHFLDICMTEALT